MLVRSSLKRLANSLCYPMSSKKTTEQWRKPIQQLKKQKQQETPISPDAEKKHKAAVQYYEKHYFSQLTQDVKNPKEKKIFKKKGSKQSTTQQQTFSTQKQQKTKTPQVNWLDKVQFKQNTQLTQLTNEALNMSKLKYLPELKEILEKVKTKFGQNQVQHLLNALLKQNFSQNFESFKDLGVQITKFSPIFANNIIFGFLHSQEYGKLEDLLRIFRSSKFHIEPKIQEFLQLLFFKETSQQVPFEYGQSGVKISTHNSTFLKKLEIAHTYLKLSAQSDKKRKAKRNAVLPLWLSRSIKIVLNYRFGRRQLKKLLNRLINNEDYLFHENFLQTELFTTLMRQFYFGSNDGLKTVFNLVERFSTKNLRFTVLHNNFTKQLMYYRIQTGKSAFEVQQELIEYYKRGFEIGKKHISLLACVIAADARYIDLAEHYVKFYVQGFPNETLSSEDARLIQTEILNNYSFENKTEERQKLLNKLTKNGNLLMTRIKAAIKLDNLTLAYKIFQQEILKSTVIKRQRKNIQFVLRNQLIQGQVTSYLQVREVDKFLQKLQDEYLWSLYTKSQDLGVLLKNYLPEDKFSFWEEHQKKELFEELSAKYARGHLEKIKQPPSDIDASGFNFEEYLNTEFPQLRQLEAEKYEKQKEIIKYTLRVEGLIEYQKVHSDDLVIEKLSDFLEQLSEQSLQILQSFGLKDYDIKEWGWNEYVVRFNKMKAYHNIVKDEKLDWGQYYKLIEKNKKLANKQIVEEMMIKTPELFQEAEALVKIEQDPIVNNLLLWGVYTKQPMAIYLGQKLAMQTGQVIPHNIARLVSQTLSYRRPLSEEFINKCKQCLKIVGKIDRQFIYEFDKDYEHILQRRQFRDYIQQTIKDPRSDNTEYQDLLKISPRQFLDQNESRIYQESIVSRVV